MVSYSHNAGVRLYVRLCVASQMRKRVEEQMYVSSFSNAFGIFWLF